MIQLEVHPEAKTEFDEAFDHYLQIDPDLAVAFGSTVFAYRRQICQEPLLYNLREGATRRVNLTPRFGEYYIAYMTWKQKVIILAVAHAKRQPYYWRDRIEDSKEKF